MRWVIAASLCAGILLWRITPDFEAVVPRVVCAAACMAAILAARKSGYLWVAAFGGIAVIFNPIVPDTVSRIVFSVLYVVCASITLLGLAMLNIGDQKPALSVLVQRRVALDCRAAGRGSMGPEEAPLSASPLLLD